MAAGVSNPVCGECLDAYIGMTRRLFDHRRAAESLDGCTVRADTAGRRGADQRHGQAGDADGRNPPVRSTLRFCKHSPFNLSRVTQDTEATFCGRCLRATWFVQAQRLHFCPVVAKKVSLCTSPRELPLLFSFPLPEQMIKSCAYFLAFFSERYAVSQCSPLFLVMSSLS